MTRDRSVRVLCVLLGSTSCTAMGFDDSQTGGIGGKADCIADAEREGCTGRVDIVVKDDEERSIHAIGTISSRGYWTESAFEFVIEVDPSCDDSGCSGTVARREHEDVRHTPTPEGMHDRVARSGAGYRMAQAPPLAVRWEGPTFTTQVGYPDSDVAGAVIPHFASWGRQRDVQRTVWRLGLDVEGAIGVLAAEAKRILPGGDTGFRPIHALILQYGRTLGDWKHEEFLHYGTNYSRSLDDQQAALDQLGVLRTDLEQHLAGIENPCEATLALWASLLVDARGAVWDTLLTEMQEVRESRSFLGAREDLGAPAVGLSAAVSEAILASPGLDRPEASPSLLHDLYSGKLCGDFTG